MRKSILLYVSLWLILCSALTGCKLRNRDIATGPRPEEPVILHMFWWGSPQRADMTAQVLDLFTQVHPHITFVTEFASWNDYWDKLATYAAANSLPDVIQHDYAKIGQYVRNGLLADLSPYLESGIIDLSDVDDLFVSSGAFGDAFYGLALGINALGMLVDPAVLADAGLPLPDTDWTWEDYEALTTHVHKKTGLQTGVPLIADPKFMIEYFARSLGKSMFSPDGTRLGFEDPSILIDYFEIGLRMIRTGVSKGAAELLMSSPLEEDDLVLGKTLGGPVWSNTAVMLTDTANRPLTLLLPPRYAKGSHPALYLKPSMFFSLPAASQHPDAAAKLINFWINDIDANRILAAERGVPISGKVRAAMNDSLRDSVRMTFDYIQLAAYHSGPIDPPEPSGAGEVTQLIKEINEEVLFGRTSPQEAAERIIREANELLARSAPKPVE